MRTLLLLCASLLAIACKPNPSKCTEQGDESACNELCDTGKEEYQPLCYEMRTRKVEACVDKDTDCAAACDLWKNAIIDETIKNYYVAKLGTEAKVATLEKKCGGAAPAAAPPTTPTPTTP
jgi:hypothetical protein